MNKRISNLNDFMNEDVDFSKDIKIYSYKDDLIISKHWKDNYFLVEIPGITRIKLPKTEISSLAIFFNNIK